MSALPGTSSSWLRTPPEGKRKNFYQNVVFGLTILATIVVLTPIVIVAGYVVREGLSAITLEFLTEGPRRDGAEGGIWPVIVLTGYTLILVVVMAVPFGVGPVVRHDAQCRHRSGTSGSGEQLGPGGGGEPVVLG